MLEQEPIVVTTVYKPASSEVAEIIVGLLNDEVNPFGPVQEYVAVATFGVFKFNVAPSHNGPFDPARAVGDALITTVTEDVAVQPPFVTVTV